MRLVLLPKARDLRKVSMTTKLLQCPHVVQRALHIVSNSMMWACCGESDGEDGLEPGYGVVTLLTSYSFYVCPVLQPIKVTEMKSIRTRRKEEPVQSTRVNTKTWQGKRLRTPGQDNREAMGAAASLKERSRRSSRESSDIPQSPKNVAHLI